MSNLLGLARDHLDRMFNPGFGAAVNEEYSQRLASLLQQEGMRAQLEQELVSVTDPDILTSHGWLWLLGWARARRLLLPEDLLIAVYGRWSNVFLKAAVIEAAVGNAEQIDAVLGRPVLERILRDVTAVPETLREDEQGVATRRAEETLLALLHVETTATLSAARALLDHEWRGREQLLTFFDAIMSSLEEEARRRWMAQLRPPREERPLQY